MATTIGLGVPVPKLLPVTATFALPFAAYLALLSGRVSALRIDKQKWIGERALDGVQADELQVATRSHLNYLENVPLALLITAFAELNGANRKVLTYGLTALLALRVAHVEFGMRVKDSTGQGRIIGHLGTLSYIVGITTYGAYLVKGWWGY